MSESNLPKSVQDTAPQCVECGACCFSQAADYLRVLGVDYERLGDAAERLTQFIGNRAYMKMEEGHCAALTYEAKSGHFLCSIYERRPDVCRWLERGSGYCVAERHEKTQRAGELAQIRKSPRKGVV